LKGLNHSVSFSLKYEERLGLVVLIASLLVALVIIGFVFKLQQVEQKSRVLQKGQYLLNSFTVRQHETENLQDLLGEFLRTAPDLEGETLFAYLIIRDTENNEQAKVINPEVTVPPFYLAKDPSGWHSKRFINMPENKKPIHELSAPVLAKGELIGSIALGFFAPSFWGQFYSYRFLAILILPVMLLGAFLYFFVKRELRPVSTLNILLQKVLDSDEFDLEAHLKPSGITHQLNKRLVRVLQKSKEQIQKLKGEQICRQVSDNIAIYRKGRLESILKALPEGIIVVDDTGTITLSNDGLGGLLNSDKEVKQGNMKEDWCEHEELFEFMGRFEGHNKMLRHSQIMEFKPDPLLDKTIAVHAIPLISRVDEPVAFGTLFVFRDITLEAMARQARGEFVAQVSHELKSPLNVLHMYSEMLLGEEGKSEDFRLEAGNIIFEETERLSQLISNLLSISKIEMGSTALERQRVKLRDLLQDTFTAVSRAVKRDDILFNLELPAEMSTIFVDKDLLRIAISNLLTNAIKYTMAGGRVTFSAEEDDHAIRINVNDTGVGISPEDKKRIFLKFFRSDDEEVRNKPGHGLGLPLAKSIIELHHGTLTVESSHGEGSVFSVHFNKGGGFVREEL
jgi:signal transduction histidine kinase